MRGLFRRLALTLIVLGLGPSCTRSGSGGSSSSPPSILLVSQTVDATGGTVAVTDPASPAVGTKVVIPPGALSTATTITISQVLSGSHDPSDVLDFEFGPTGTVFAAPVTVTVKYLGAYISDHAVTDPTNLRILERSPNSPSAVLVTTALDPVGHTISAQTGHFTGFAALLFTNATLQGVYYVQGLSVDDGIGIGSHPAGFQNQGFFCDFGTVTFDGAGNANASILTEKYDQGLSPPSAPLTGTYTVSSDGTFTLGMADFTPVTGAILAGGDLAFFTNQTPTGLVQTGILLRKSGSFTLASLSGTYSFQAFSVDDGAGIGSQPTSYQNQGFFTDFGTITFDGVGGLTLDLTVEKYDQTLNPPATLTGTYTVATDGTFTLNPGSTPVTGQILAGGTVLAFSNQAGTGFVQTGLALRKSGTFTTASLLGSYYFQAFSVDDGLGIGSHPPDYANQGFFCDFGTIAFDGAGNLTARLLPEKYDQTLNPPATLPGTYSVAADGTFVLTVGSNLPVSGALLPGGTIGIFGNSSASGFVQTGMMLLANVGESTPGSLGMNWSGASVTGVWDVVTGFGTTDVFSLVEAGSGAISGTNSGSLPITGTHAGTRVTLSLSSGLNPSFSGVVAPSGTSIFGTVTYSNSTQDSFTMTLR
jgi:hypothetical protein